MEIEEKSIITFDDCKKALENEVKTSIHENVAILIAVIFTFIPLSFFGIYLINIALSAALVIFISCAGFILYAIYWAIKSIWHKRLVKKNAFEIVTDTVIKKEETGMNMKRSERPLTNNIIYFSKYGRFAPPNRVFFDKPKALAAAEQATFTYTAIGDEFYLVVLKTRKPTVYISYHTNMYEYCEKK